MMTTKTLKLCSIQDCEEEYYAKGLCKKHHKKQWQKNSKDHVLEYRKEYNQNHKEEIIKYSKQYYLKNRENCIKKANQWCKDNPERKKEYRKQYHKDNEEYISEKNKQWRQDNPEYCVKKRKQYRDDNPEYFIKYRQNNKEHIVEWYKRYRQTPAGIAASKASVANHRALTKDLTIETVQRVYEDNIKKYGTLTCVLCDKPIKFKEDSLEHLTPLSRGGTNNYDNLGIAHLICNLRKGVMTLEEWHGRP